MTFFFKLLLFSALSFVFSFVCLILGLDLNLLFMKMESLILGKGLSFFLQRVGCTGGILLAVIFKVFLDEVTLANMMVASGASGASSSGVNQAPLLPALQPQPPAAELDGGGAANKNVGVGVVPPAESSASNNSNQPIFDAPPLQEGDQESHHHGQHPDPREQLLSSSEALNKRLRDLFSQTGNPLKDSSAIFDITDAILGGSTDPNRISEVLNNLHEFGTQSQWFVEALRAKDALDTHFYLEEGVTSSSDSE